MKSKGHIYSILSAASRILGCRAAGCVLGLVMAGAVPVAAHAEPREMELDPTFIEAAPPTPPAPLAPAASTPPAVPAAPGGGLLPAISLPKAPGGGPVATETGGTKPATPVGPVVPAATAPAANVAAPKAPVTAPAAASGPATPVPPATSSTATPVKPEAPVALVPNNKQKEGSQEESSSAKPPVKDAKAPVKEAKPQAPAASLLPEDENTASLEAEDNKETPEQQNGAKPAASAQAPEKKPENSAKPEGEGKKDNASKKDAPKKEENARVLRWRGSLMYSQNDIRLLNEAISAMTTGKSIEALIQAPVAANDPQKNTASAPNKVTYPDYAPAYFLNSILYISPKEWIVWLNSKKISSTNKPISTGIPFLQIVSVTPNSATFTWKTQFLNQLAPDWKKTGPQARFAESEITGEFVAKNGMDIHVNGDQNLVTFTLHPHQTFTAHTMEIVEGPAGDVYVKEDGAKPASASSYGGGGAQSAADFSAPSAGHGLGIMDAARSVMPK